MDITKANPTNIMEDSLATVVVTEEAVTAEEDIAVRLDENNIPPETPVVDTVAMDAIDHNYYFHRHPCFFDSSYQDRDGIGYLLVAMEGRRAC